MRIMLDLDGVFFNFGDSCRRYLEHIGKGHLWKSGPTPNPYWDFFKDWGWTGKDFVDFCNAGADAGFIFAGPMREGTKEAWDALVETGHDIIVCTDRPFGSDPSVSQKLTVDWLHEHDLWYDELIFSADKTASNADMAIDDKIENYDALIRAGTKAFLLNRPWNVVDGGDARNRIDTVDQFVEAVKTATNAGHYDLTFS